ncbi:MAG: N-acetylglucosamine-6-phosphate deacetylase [Clostridia bacterium]|nr:N-acetylglucosamine-6-phosphate deacetylase [Clostridia bacterium]
MILKGGTVLDGDFVFEKCDIETDGGKITGIGSYSGKDVLDCSDCYIVPGLIDVHTHGCLGYDYTAATKEEIAKMREYLLSNGVTSFLPTLLTQSRETYFEAVKKMIAAKECGGARILGIHLEGPYYSEKYKGAQNPEFIRSASVTEFEEINAASGENVKLISLAPETEGAVEFIKSVCDRVRVAVGHTAADYDEARAAFLAGASQLTHTFNGMPPLHHRNPGVIGAAFEQENVLCECICDGFHLHPSTVRLLFSAVGADRVVLISDSIAAAGLPDCEFSMGGLPTVVKDGKAYLSDGKTIAGSTVTVYDSVRRAIEFGISPEDAFKAATKNAAISAGAEDIVGSIEIGKNADMLVLSKDFGIKYIILNGKIVNEV